MIYDADTTDYRLPSKDPFQVFEIWYRQVKKKQSEDPTVVNLATVSKNRPKSRTVLLKDFNGSKFTFFTNYSSDKGKELAENPYAALTFWWKSCDYQVRVEGKIQKSTREASINYFRSRSRDSQLASIVSSQSSPIDSRDKLLKMLEAKRLQTEGHDLDCPPDWGGYDLIPDRFIFFIYGEHRINDRFEFLLKEDFWEIRRLQP